MHMIVDRARHTKKCTCSMMINICCQHAGSGQDTSAIMRTVQDQPQGLPMHQLGSSSSSIMEPQQPHHTKVKACAASVAELMASCRNRPYISKLRRHNVYVKVWFAEPEDLAPDFVDKVRTSTGGMITSQPVHHLVLSESPCTAMAGIIWIRSRALHWAVQYLLRAQCFTHTRPAMAIAIPMYTNSPDCKPMHHHPRHPAADPVQIQAGLSQRTGGQYTITGASVRRGCIELALDMVSGAHQSSNNNSGADGTSSAASSQHTAPVDTQAVAGPAEGRGHGGLDVDDEDLVGDVPPDDWVHWLYLQPPPNAEVLVQVGPAVPTLPPQHT